MFRYFILRPEQQLFCYLYGCALALVQMVLFLLYPGQADFIWLRYLSRCSGPVWPCTPGTSTG